MQRQGMKQPLLIGGATTSRAHTAIKIAPNYSGPVVYVPDASRAVGVSPVLLSIDHAAEFSGRDQGRLHRGGARPARGDKKGIASPPLPTSCSNRFVWNERSRYRPAHRKSLGLHVLRRSTSRPRRFHRLGTFFPDLGSCRQLPEDPRRCRGRPTARAVFSDAQAMLQRVISEKWLSANAVFGLFPANAVGDDIEIYADESRSEQLLSWHNLRQQHERPAGKPHYCLSDFIAERGTPDWIGAFAVGAGFGIEAKLAEFAAAHDDYRSIMLKAIADRLAEACAEWLHAAGTARLLGLRQ
jgi:5-methyltetrahydrofolate--homocysteine methyltransferase